MNKYEIWVIFIDRWEVLNNSGTLSFEIKFDYKAITHTDASSSPLKVFSRTNLSKNVEYEK